MILRTNTFMTVLLMFAVVIAATAVGILLFSHLWDIGSSRIIPEADRFPKKILDTPKKDHCQPDSSLIRCADPLFRISVHQW